MDQAYPLQRRPPVAEQAQNGLESGLCEARRINLPCFRITRIRRRRSPADCRAFLCARAPERDAFPSRSSRVVASKSSCRNAPGRPTSRRLSATIASGSQRALESFAAELSPESYRLPSLIGLPAIDRRVIVTYRNAPGTVRVRERGDTLIVSGIRYTTAMQCAKALRRWLSRTARDQLGRQLADLAADLESVLSQGCTSAHSAPAGAAIRVPAARSA